MTMNYDDNNTITIPRWSLHLLTREGFMRRFLHHTATAKNYKQAYDRTEAEHISYFRARRYSDYYSFKKCKSEWQNSKVKPTAVLCLFLNT